MYHIKTQSYNSEDPLFTKLRGGNDTLIVPDARVAKDYFNTGIYERGYIQWACENFVREGKEVIDIGAHIGIYTVEMAKIAKRVHSFECSPKTYNYLCANILLRDLSYKVKTYNTALSDKKGITKYYIRDPKDGGGNGISGFEKDRDTPTIDVPMIELDTFNLTNIGFIKMDVEGHEEFVLRGAVKTLEQNDYPPILFESWPERYTDVPAKKLRESLFQFIESLGYKVIQVHGGTDDMFLATKEKSTST
jgi:FkbM family methyltransferase